ncbi:type VI secretion system baseplate subunit TssK [Desulfobotulus sp.]|jgi:type VI secretion system protein ImpJ|uniref:type VI secretion system baseplate subunit TssK n=1 Tax=Desulfobotulus sp. TaxID=1940337 RepID=UPI002A36113E|nr:type VI secretion system baseplate subunit TssK [Desulfobotulus sp.]MDY0162847.1 type VI secretion system baseplate subunit TssK [Desulfobotulus sp.]
MDKLARIRWEMGQTLLPEHLMAQEDSLAAECDARFRTLGLPFHGLARLQISSSLLREGVLTVQQLSAVMPSGLFLGIPGNARIESLNMNTFGKTRLPLYLHLVSGMDDRPEGGGDGEENIPRRVHRLALSPDQARTGAQETMRFGIFQKSPEGNWSLAAEGIPPLLQLGSSPFFRQETADLMQLLEVFEHKVSQDIAASYLSGDSMFSARECLKSALRTHRFLVNLSGQIRPHPYFLYEVLKDFLTDVAFYRNLAPEHVLEPYDHEDLATCFRKILMPLHEHIRYFQRSSPYLPLTCRDGLWQLVFPEEVRKAKEVYLLVQKARVQDRVVLENLKMTARSRLSLIHRLALQGIPFTRMERPPFQHMFGPEVDFYRLHSGDEWDQALKELSLVFYDGPALQGVQFFLYWREN